MNLPLLKDISNQKIKNLIDNLPYKKIDDILVAVSQGDISPKKIVRLTFPENEIFKKKIISKIPLSIKTNNVLFGANQRLSYKIAENCCKPQFPVPIIGYITRRHGISVHKLNCKNLTSKDTNRLIVAHWEQNKQYQYDVDLFISCHDRVGMLHDITEVIMDEKLNLVGIKTIRKTKKYAKLLITVNINDLDQLTSLINKISTLPGVEEVKKNDL